MAKLIAVRCTMRTPRSVHSIGCAMYIGVFYCNERLQRLLGRMAISECAVNATCRELVSGFHVQMDNEDVRAVVSA